MDSEEEVFKRLSRSAFDTVILEIVESQEFKNNFAAISRMNSEKKWRVAEDIEYILLRNNWSVEDFNEELNKRRRYDWQ